MSARLRLVALGLVVLASSATLDVRADDAAESRFFDAIARDAYGHHRYPEALEAFLRAHRAAPSARSLYNIALCAQLAHRDTMAFAYFDEFLRAADADPALRGDATTRRDALARQLAVIHVESDPPGATIFVDQRDHGSFGIAPRTFALPPGAHHIELVLADHADGVADLSAVVGEIAALRVPLVAYRGAVTITTSVEGATIAARSRGDEVSITPGARTELAVGHYTFVASAPGHRDASVELQIVRDANEHRALDLEALPVPTGQLLVTTAEIRARVRVDGSDRAETPARVAALTVGSHEVSVTADGYLEWTGTIEVEENRTAFVSVTLVRAR